MKQIAKNSEVSIVGCLEMFTANGLGKNLGWVLDPKNAKIRAKIRTAIVEGHDINS